MEIQRENLTQTWSREKLRPFTAGTVRSRSLSSPTPIPFFPVTLSRFPSLSQVPTPISPARPMQTEIPFSLPPRPTQRGAPAVATGRREPRTRERRSPGRSLTKPSDGPAWWRRSSAWSTAGSIRERSGGGGNFRTGLAAPQCRQSSSSSSSTSSSTTSRRSSSDVSALDAVAQEVG